MVDSLSLPLPNNPNLPIFPWNVQSFISRTISIIFPVDKSRAISSIRIVSKFVHNPDCDANCAITCFIFFLRAEDIFHQRASKKGLRGEILHWIYLFWEEDFQPNYFSPFSALLPPGYCNGASRALTKATTYPI